MAIQKFSLDAVNKVRHYIQETFSLTTTDLQSQTWSELDDATDVPEPESLDDLSGIFAYGGLRPEEMPQITTSGHWAISTVNPGTVLRKLPGLRLKEGWRFVSYLYRDGTDGSGVVFAVPEALSTTAHLDKALRARPANGVPQPSGALTHLMEAIEGDRSPASFIAASVLWRELREFGALGQRQTWKHHRLISAVPPKANWHWTMDQPKDLAPKLKLMPDGQAIVEFFSCRVSGKIAIYRHLDQFPPGHYKLMSLDKAIAVLQR